MIDGVIALVVGAGMRWTLLTAATSRTT